MSGSQRLVVTRSVERVVTVRQGGRVLEVRQMTSPRVTVVAIGRQGPPGAVSEEVQQRLRQAEIEARAALQLADTAGEAVASLLSDLQGAFTYHAGAISAQEG